ncbi:hybrid sensor histidine kinase/response regulator [Reichenbachiella sp. MALMAid0571]|uniref:hybrid sensor histidine kinase/response regulator n=1 Tax=Reichenbachiella sp. MALMAid0571 TaxID=3143939 RepID=UPI0032E0427D
MNPENQKFNILIVDDNPKNIQVLGNILRRENYKVEFAINGEQAIDRIRIETFDLILLDVMMPVMNGIEACKEIRKTKPASDLPIIFLTAKSERNDMLEGFNAGAQDYIVKPFDSQELLSRVGTHLELKYSKELLLHKNEELNKTNKLLNESQEKLKQMVATKDLFFSIIAHDLKTPFFVLTSHSELLVKHIEATHNFTSDSKILETAKALNSVSKNGKSMLNNLLQWALSQTGKLNNYPESINVNSFVNHLVDNFYSTARLKKIELIYEPTENYLVRVDKHMLDTIFVNLFTNAIKFTHEKGQINISTKEEKGFVEISISDSGIGIKKENIDNLFRIEKKTKSIGTQGEEGSGLGLLLCKEFAEANGGTIKVESIENQGSTFTVILPLSDE